MGDGVSKPPLTFADVDELSGVADLSMVRNFLDGLEARRLGPVLEYAMLVSQSPGALPPLPVSHGPSLAQHVDRVLRRGRRDQATSSTRFDAFDHELLPLPPTTAEFNSEPRYIAFRRRLEMAARGAGFRERTARGIAGAFGEMADNVFEHSEAPDTAFVGYRWELGEVEFVVADQGVGVLKSLRTSARYQHVQDDGTALNLAVRKGESRIDARGRGLGFTNLVMALANLQGSVRLSSGGARLDMDGQDLVSLPVRVSQARPFQGFLVSVQCRPE